MKEGMGCFWHCWSLMTFVNTRTHTFVIKHIFEKYIFHQRLTFWVHLYLTSSISRICDSVCCHLLEILKETQFCLKKKKKVSLYTFFVGKSKCRVYSWNGIETNLDKIVKPLFTSGHRLKRFSNWPWWKFQQGFLFFTPGFIMFDCF